MLNRIVLVAAIVVLMAPMSTCKACITTWLLADDDSRQVRAGWQDDKYGIEAGITALWLEDESQIYGVYGVWHVLEPVNIPNFFGFGPETLEGYPYVGAQVSAAIDSDDKGDLYGPIAGLLIQNIVVVEWQYRIVDNVLEGPLDDEHKVVFGLLWRF